MLTSSREKHICKTYSKKDSEGRVQCFECPLRKGSGDYDFRCKANSRFNSKLMQWEQDDVNN